MNSSFECPPIKNLPWGKQCWQAPSNIALVKYWGKYGLQFPKNPSLSFTLQTSVTTTEISYKPAYKKTPGVSFQFFFEGETRSDFHPKLKTFFERVLPYQPFLQKLDLTISSSNSFPHSSGIASSASAYAALAAALVGMEQSCFPASDPSYWEQKRSFLARLGSGSASRSLQGPMMLWGEHSAFTGSSNEFAIPFGHKLPAIFLEYQDYILLVDKGQKKVSSTVGHDLMKGHPFAEARFDQAHTNMQALATAMEAEDLEAFIQIVESEALTLHAMMQSSHPYYLLMRPNTLHIIEAIWAFRAESKIPLCFTLDAGANVHLLFPKQYQTAVDVFISEQLLVYCQDKEYLMDCVGWGAKKL